MNIVKKIKFFITKKKVKMITSIVSMIILTAISVTSTWAWFTHYVTPKNSDVSIRVSSTSVSVQDFFVEKVNEDESTDVVFDINDENANNTFLTGLLIGEEYIFTFTLTSEYDGLYRVSLGMDGVNGGANFTNLLGQNSNLNMTDVCAMKLESITPDSTPPYDGSYDYRWLNESKLANGKFEILKDFNSWNSNIGDLTITCRLKVSADLTTASVNINELSRKSVSITNFYVVADLIGGY